MILPIILQSLFILDAVTTEIGLGKGIAIEKNPLMKNKWARVAGNIFNFSIPFSFSYIKYEYPITETYINILFLLLIGGYSAIGINNIYQLSKYFRDKGIDFSEIERKIKEKLNLP